MRVDAPAVGTGQGNAITIGRKGPMGEWLQAGEWNFLAFTWKFDGQVATAYQGTTTGLKMVVTKYTDVSGPIHLKPAWFGGIGNCRTDDHGRRAVRPMSGYIDNVRVFSKALDTKAIEAIYKADLKNEVPKFPDGAAKQ